MQTQPLRAEAPPRGVGRAVELLSSEPHRLMFFFGALQGVVAFGWWAADIVARYGASEALYAWTVPAMWAHGWLLLYGFFPFFMFGFLMTAGPNWLGAPKPPRAAFVPAAVAMAAGIVLFYTGLVLKRELAAAGILVHFAGWLWGIGALVRMLVRYWNPNARYALVLFVFFGIGCAGSAIFGLSVATASYAFAVYALHGAVWFFLMPIFAGVSTRMVPFFSSRILGPAVDYKPSWARPALMAGVIAHGALELSGAGQWLWVIDAPLALIVAYLAGKWGLTQSFRVRLLAVLHISLAVLASAFTLYALLSAAVATQAVSRVGLAPLHLLTIGYFAAMTVGMVSRVSLGHSGRPLEADTWTWCCYLGLLMAALLRAIAEFSVGTEAGRVLMVFAALTAFGSFAGWAWRYVPMYVTPRADAR